MMKTCKQIFLSLFLMMIVTGCANVVSTEPTSSPIATGRTMPTLNPVTPTVATPPTAVLQVSANVKAALDQEHVLNPDGTINSKLLHSETAKIVSILPDSIQKLSVNDTSVTEIVTGKDASGQRYIWNAEANGWVTDLATYVDYANPANSPSMENSGFGDGSANLIKVLYEAENPNLIPTNAAHPYYKANVHWDPNTGAMSFSVSLFRDNQFMFKDALETKSPLQKNAKPFAWTGLFRTKDSQNNEIYVICQQQSNPTTENPKQTINVFYGLDKKSYELISNLNNSGFNEIISTIEKDDTELVLIFPPPVGSTFDPKTFSVGKQPSNPAVAGLQNQNAVTMFSPDEQKQIMAIFQGMQAGKFPDGTHNSVALISLPEKINHMIVFAGFVQYEFPIIQ